jgi:O-antigen ligase
MNKNIPNIVLGLYFCVMFLLPFSRLAELPILLLCLIGIYAIYQNWQVLKSNAQFKILSWVFASYFFSIMLSAPDSYWQDKTLSVALFSWRFFLASVALIVYLQQKQFIILFKALTILALVWALDALFQYFYGVDLIGRASYEGRLNGVFGEHHVKLGPVLALLLPMVMIGLRKQRSILRWLSSLLLIVVIVLSGTRSAWLMMVFTLMAYWFHHVKQRRLQLMLKALFVAVVMIGGLWMVSPEFQQRVQRSMGVFEGTESGLDFALADRLPIWKTAYRMIESHPINGIGAHAFRKAYPNYALENDSWQQQGGVGMHAHHWVLEILAETGMIGLLLIGFAIFKLWLFVKNNYHQHYSWAFAVALMAAFLPITSTYSIFASFWSICIWFIGSGLIVVSKKYD